MTGLRTVATLVLESTRGRPPDRRDRHAEAREQGGSRRCGPARRKPLQRSGRARARLPLHNLNTELSSPKTLWSTSTNRCVLCNPLKNNERGFDPGSCRSASLAFRDILFRPFEHRRNATEGGPFGSFVRTTNAGPERHFGQFSVSLRPSSLTHPNHGR